MISYKYKLYQSKKNKALDYMMAEAAFVWNHALALQKRYYSLASVMGWEDTLISPGKMYHHFAKRIKRNRLNAQTMQEILERLYSSFNRFFKKKCSRLPKFRKSKDFSSIVFKQSGYKLYGNEFIINRISKRFKFSLSRLWEGNVKIVRVIRSHKQWYIIVVTDANPKQYRKTHTGASVGVDFGFKTFITLSDGTEILAPLYYKKLSHKIKKTQRALSKTEKGSNHYLAYWAQLYRLFASLKDKRVNWNYQTAHRLCKLYEHIFIEDLNIRGMMEHKRWGSKVSDLGWTSFVKVLEYVASKYGVTVHKVDRWFASSRLCDCGYKNTALRLRERVWTCPECGRTHKRDLLAAMNIYRQGIADLGSTGKTSLGLTLAGAVR